RRPPLPGGARSRRRCRWRPRSPAPSCPRASCLPAAYSGRPVACSPMAEPIPIIGGTGALGYGLAVRWAQAGEHVVIGSRQAERAAEAADRVRAAAPDAEVEGLQNAEAAGRGPIVFLTVPFRAQSETLTNLRDALQPGQILVDCTVPTAAAFGGKASRTIG